jgi:putative PIN family toxin of toxin-antitoxin system
MKPRVLYDTNVMVSAALKARSTPASVVAFALSGQVIPCLSQIILKEYREVLKRSKFGFEARTVEAFLKEFRAAAKLVRPRKRVQAALEGADNRFLECAQAARAEYLVTGNKKHFPVPAFGKTRIVSPAELLHVLSER